MKTIGTVGGVGPESTIDYYRLLVAGEGRWGCRHHRRQHAAHRIRRGAAALARSDGEHHRRCGAARQGGGPDQGGAARHAIHDGRDVVPQFLPETRDGVLQVIDRMQDDLAVQAIILGGTELPILLRAQEHNGLTLLDTTKIHAYAVLRAVSRSSAV